MIRIMKASETPISEILTRDIKIESGVEDKVRAIIDDIRARGDEALLDYTERFDGVRPENLRVTEEEIEAAYASEDPEFLETLRLAYENIRDFHANQFRTGFQMEKEGGIILGQKVSAIERAGLYVPGGTARYPSSVLMNAVPAKLAGVKELVMVTPPDKDGSIPSAILAAAKIAGVDTIVKIGGAQAVAALAYGTESTPKVDKVVGPGNIFVATAKRMLYGVVDIDMIAGPSEILVVADGNCDPRLVAADLLSQAEHDRLASAVLVTDSTELAEGVSAELEKQIPTLMRAEIARESIDVNGKIILVDNMDEAVEISNEIAPEHLELCVDDPFALLEKVKHAGSVFLGRNVPEALGDYFAGPNHTLPTSGTARFSSPLSVDDFVKKTQYLSYSAEALAAAKDHVARFAAREGLEAHGLSVLKRFE